MTSTAAWGEPMMHLKASAKIFCVALILAGNPRLAVATAESDKPILLTCIGSETTTGNLPNRKTDSETVAFTRLYELRLQDMNVRSNHAHTYLDGRDSSKYEDTGAIKKNVWVLRVDSGDAIYEQDDTTIWSNSPNPSTTLDRASVTVTDTTIEAHKSHAYQDRNHGSTQTPDDLVVDSSTYSLTINRFTGMLSETTIERGAYGRSQSEFRTEANGKCIAARKQF